LRAGAIHQVVDEAAKLKFGIAGLQRSQLPGTHGNLEYLLWITPNQPWNGQEWNERIDTLAKEGK
jgi:23S rRNA (cytidine1920-2'-O)/16S rRNA (cytidine1409-2'-O)-methyltransferase